MDDIIVVFKSGRMLLKCLLQLFLPVTVLECGSGYLPEIKQSIVSTDLESHHTIEGILLAAILIKQRQAYVFQCEIRRNNIGRVKAMFQFDMSMQNNSDSAERKSALF